MTLIKPASAEEYEELSGIISRIINEDSSEQVDAILVFKVLALCRIAVDALSYTSDGMTVEDAIDLAGLEYREMFK